MKQNALWFLAALSLVALSMRFADAGADPPTGSDAVSLQTLPSLECRVHYVVPTLPYNAKYRGPVLTKTLLIRNPTKTTVPRGTRLQWKLDNTDRKGIFSLERDLPGGKELLLPDILGDPALVITIMSSPPVVQPCSVGPAPDLNVIRRKL